MSGSMLGAGSQRGMEMTSSAGDTVGLGAREGSNPFYLGNQRLPRRRGIQAVCRRKNRCVRGEKLVPGHSRNQPKERPGGQQELVLVGHGKRRRGAAAKSLWGVSWGRGRT